MAAIGVVFDTILTLGFTEGVWFGLIFLVSPLVGIILGPYDGFISTLLSVMVGHTINPRGVFEYLFTLGAPIGSLISAYVYRGEFRRVVVYYSFMIVAYLLTPISWSLPLWGMWDTILAYAAVITLTLISKKRVIRNRKLVFAMSAFIGLEADVLFRIFLFIPGQTYWLFYGLTPEVLYFIWSIASVITPVKVATSTAAITILGPTLIRRISKLGRG